MRLLCGFACALAAFGQDVSTWTDATTGLKWTITDSGAPVTFVQANRYCSQLKLTGESGWRLPTIDELQKLFGGAANATGHRILAPIKLTGWQWSATLGRDKGEAWALDFGDGARASVVMGDSGLSRALCVRK
jgi:hypothetical protein